MVSVIVIIIINVACRERNSSGYSIHMIVKFGFSNPLDKKALITTYIETFVMIRRVTNTGNAIF